NQREALIHFGKLLVNGIDNAANLRLEVAKLIPHAACGVEDDGEIEILGQGGPRIGQGDLPTRRARRDCVRDEGAAILRRHVGDQRLIRGKLIEREKEYGPAIAARDDLDIIWTTREPYVGVADWLAGLILNNDEQALAAQLCGNVAKSAVLAHTADVRTENDGIDIV